MTTLGFLFFNISRKFSGNVYPRKKSNVKIDIFRSITLFTLFDGDITAIHHGDKDCLGQRVFEREQLVLGHRSRTRPQDGLSKQNRQTVKHLCF